MRNLINLAVGISALAGVSQAATVLVTPGLAGASIQGVTLETSLDHTQLVDSANYVVAVGRYSGSTFTPWSGTSTVVDNATGSPSREVSGSFASSTGGAFDGLQIHIFVGLLSAVATGQTASFTPTGTEWVVFTQNTSSLFTPSAGSGSTTVNMTTPTVLSIVANGDAGNIFNGNNSGATSGTVTNYFYFNTVPEPSVALLGAVGALGLLRRRRN